MNAKEAKERAIKAQLESVKNGYDSVMKQIQNSIVRGELCTNIYGSINEVVAKKLKDDGYIVGETVYDRYDRSEPYTKISWD